MSLINIKFQILKEIIADVRNVSVAMNAIIILWRRNKYTADKAIEELTILQRSLTSLMDDLLKEGF